MCSFVPLGRLLRNRLSGRVKIGKTDHIRLAEARKKARELMNQIQSGVEAKVHVPESAEPKRTIGSLVQELLMDEALGYEAIVDRVVAEFPDAKTSVRSVASVAAVLRKKGTDVPMRRRSKG